MWALQILKDPSIESWLVEIPLLDHYNPQYIKGIGTHPRTNHQPTIIYQLHTLE